MKQKVRIKLILVLFLIGIIVPGFSLAATFTVNNAADEVDNNIGDCICLTGSQTCTLRAAIQEANACQGEDTININPGTYVLSLAGAGEDTSATGDLDITDNVIIIGSVPVLPVIDANKLDRIFHILPGITTKISNLVIQNGIDGGAGVGQAQAGYGGCIKNEGTLESYNFVIQNCTANNTASCTWQNPCIGYGGAIYNIGQLTLNYTLLLNNKTSSSYCQDAGGGIFNLGTLLYQNGTCSNNRGGLSGCLHNAANASATIRGVNLQGNKADCYGAGVGNSGIADIESSTFNGTKIITAENCGGIYNGGTMTVTNSTLTGHRLYSGLSQGNGGAICNGGVYWSADGNLSLKNVTITDNSAPRGGGGIYNRTNSTVTLKNTIVANSPEGGNCNGTITSQGHNLDSANTCGFSDPDDLNDTDPKLGPVQNNGGPTLTHALLPGSPAIDHGDSTDCPATDQRGVTRPKGEACDIGAFEFVPQLFLPLILKSS